MSFMLSVNCCVPGSLQARMYATALTREMSTFEVTFGIGFKFGMSSWMSGSELSENGCAHRWSRVGYGILFVRSREGDTAQYPVNQRIVAGEPVVSQHYGTRGIKRSYVECKRSDMSREDL